MNLPSNSLLPVFHFFLLLLSHFSAAQQFLNSQPFPSCLNVPASDACSISIIITVSSEKRPAGLKRHGHHKGSGMSGSRAWRSVRGMAFTFQKRQTKWTPALFFFFFFFFYNIRHVHFSCSTTSSVTISCSLCIRLSFSVTIDRRTLRIWGWYRVWHFGSNKGWRADTS